jgi:hypothetical protein
LARLQIKGVSFDFLDDVFLQNLPLEAAERILERLTVLELYLSQVPPPAFTMFRFPALHSRASYSLFRLRSRLARSRLSVSPSPGLKLASRLAAIVIVSPVLGLRLCRAFLSSTTKLLKQRRFAPSCGRSLCATWAFPKSVWATTFSINCRFVMQFEFSSF